MTKQTLLALLAVSAAAGCASDPNDGPLDAGAPDSGTPDGGGVDIGPPNDPV